MLEPAVGPPLEALKEQINTNLTELQANVDASLNGPGLINAFDNVVPSMLANLSRLRTFGVDCSVVCHDIIFIGPIGVVFSLISFGIESWYRHRYRDDWEAYWALEIERFEKLSNDLQLLSKKIPHHNNPFRNSYEIYLKEIYQSLIRFKEDTDRLQALFELDAKAYQEKLDKIKEVNKKIKELSDIFYTLGFTLSELKKIAAEAAVAKTNSSLIAPISALQQAAMFYDSAAEQIAKKPKEKPDDKPENSWLDVISNIPDLWVFNVVFAYSWNYWAVFFFTLWGIPTPFSVVPLSWGLLALIAPIGYLFYKEYEAYQKERLSLEKDKLDFEKEIQQLNKEQSLSEVDRRNCQEKYEKNHSERRKAFLWPRVLGWGFVGLVAGFSVGSLCELNFVIGPAVFVGVCVFGALTSYLVDSHFKTKHVKGTHFLDFDPKEDLNSNKTKVTMPRQKAAFLRRFQQKWMRFKVQQAQWAYELAELDPNGVKEPLESILQPEEPDSLNSGQLVKKSARKINVADIPQNPKDYITNLERARRVVAPLINFFLGNMLGIIIGFATTDFLSHFIGAAATGVVANSIIGVIGLVLGFAFSRRAWQADKAHRKELKQYRAQDEYRKKQHELDLLNKEILAKKVALKKLIAGIRAEQDSLTNTAQQTKQFDEACEAKYKLLEKTEKPITQSKILKTIRKGFVVIVNISSVMLMSRALLVMGFAGIFTFSSGSIALIGDTCGPFGIAVFSIAAVLLVLKSCNEIYLQLEKARELKQVKYVHLKLENAQIEADHLTRVEKLLKQEYNSLARKDPEQLMNEPSCFETWTSFFGSITSQEKNDEQEAPDCFNMTAPLLVNTGK